MFFFSGDVPIVILTGRSDKALALTALQDGAQDYIFKSHMEQDALERTLRYAIERHRRQEEMDDIRSMLLKAEAVQSAAGQIKMPLSTIVEISDKLIEAAADHPQRPLFEVLRTEVRAIQNFVEKVGELGQYSAVVDSPLESG
jgi:PleD family two-component response regulator